jgi:hypothetical protein
VADDYDLLQTLRRVNTYSREASEAVLQKRTLVLDTWDKYEDLIVGSSSPIRSTQSTSDPYNQGNPYRNVMRLKVQVPWRCTKMIRPHSHLFNTRLTVDMPALREIELDVYSSGYPDSFMKDMTLVDWSGLQGHKQWTVWASRTAAAGKRVIVHGPSSGEYPIYSVISWEYQYAEKVHHYLDMSMADQALNNYAARDGNDPLVSQEWVKKYGAEYFSTG